MRSTIFDLEVIVVDDASSDGCCARLMLEASRLDAPGLLLRVLSLKERTGVYLTRNYGAAYASADILFMTDAHVRFCHHWDRTIFEQSSPNRILAATIADETSSLKGYGCELLIPSMETSWNMRPPSQPEPVQIAACTGTVISRALFEQIGGYDQGMLLYGAGEPEFSVRAWLTGAEIVCTPTLEVQHRFKPRDERKAFLQDIQLFTLYNRLRFGLLYLGELASLQMLRYFSMRYPVLSQKAFDLVEESDVWQRKAFLKDRLIHPFDWFIHRFGLKDQIGHHIL
jgi:glycosyltransferase involved in cell wall biosynthesis